MDHLTLRYTLSEMPTAQHKAGLAGLVLSVKEMQDPSRRREFSALTDDQIPKLEELGPDHAVITLSERSCQALFDDCYRARMGTVEVEKPWKGAEVLSLVTRKRVDPTTKKEKLVTLHVHPNLEPRNPFLARHLFRDDPDDRQDLWYKLWRDMIFQIPRSKPTTRNPYKEAVSGSCREGAKMWSELIKFENARRKGSIRTIRLSSSLLLGAQDTTAENVGYADRVDNSLVLNFWPLTTLIYVPTQLKIDAADASKSRAVPIGFSLAIPDVSNLSGFCNCFPGVLQQFKTNAKPQGFRPQNACVDLAAEGALDLLTQQAWLAAEKTKNVQLSGRLHAIEYVHVEKQGNNVKTLSAGRIGPEPGLLERYRFIADKYQSPLFRHCRLGSLLRRQRQPWWYGFTSFLETLPHELFLGVNLPPIAWNFRRDLRVAFFEDTDTKPLPTNESEKMTTAPTETGPRKTIELAVRNIVGTYIREKTGAKLEDENKSKQPEESVQNAGGPTSKTEFEDKRSELAKKLFLEIRSRREDDFKSYFAERFGASSQKFNLGNESDFQCVCNELLKNPGDVRIMTLLAISACS